ncbi:CaiB/BaiF CoA-transferase family protein [Halioxenophilus sp. WMMB6]|uniref:CaiB/BaiF CoA transferase family protein n=1 Tax=Halioxenophilus sp. WMMB6 TaxID=3073815 RepID=UPI00295EEFA8|nr:CaiB/BaiF CoA-transferase family protein [Halioxenophilus sp. WMMB6]
MGPLHGLKIVELEGLGPAPFCGMLLADMGAEVISITRKSSAAERATKISERGKLSIALNLKSAEGVAAVLKLIASADALIEGFRPGVAERLGLGPDVCLARNPKLVYGRMTGWGQTGPLAHTAGHDINYIALSSALNAIGRAGEKPVPPLNLVADFGGGSLFLALGVVSAIYEASRSGKGQVIDAAMVEGAALLMQMAYGFLAEGAWQDQRGVNGLDGGTHYYDTYETADGKYVALGAIEPQFYQLFLEKAGLDKAVFSEQNDPRQWPILKEQIAEVMRTKTRAEWCEIMEGSDACFAPVLSMREAPEHPHNKARGSFVTLENVLQPSPAPRFSRTPSKIQHTPHKAGSDTIKVLTDIGYSASEIEQLQQQGVIS